MNSDETNSPAVIAEAVDADLELVEACQAGDDEAFDALARRYTDRLYNVVYRFLGNHEDAQDVVQETFVRAYNSLDSFEGKSKFYTWLYSIATNLARNALRDRGRKGRDQGVSLEKLQDEAPNVAQRVTQSNARPDVVAAGNELNDALQACIETLPEQNRMVFVLRTVDGLKYDEIAAVLACPRGTVKSRLNQARVLLRDALQAQGLV
jgi:RNA polymerase sigma-70 factor, ECF subfamily